MPTKYKHIEHLTHGLLGNLLSETLAQAAASYATATILTPTEVPDPRYTPRLVRQVICDQIRNIASAICHEPNHPRRIQYRQTVTGGHGTLLPGSAGPYGDVFRTSQTPMQSMFPRSVHDIDRIRRLTPARYPADAFYYFAIDNNTLHSTADNLTVEYFEIPATFTTQASLDALFVDFTTAPNVPLPDEFLPALTLASAATAQTVEGARHPKADQWARMFEQTMAFNGLKVAGISAGNPRD